MKRTMFVLIIIVALFDFGIAQSNNIDTVGAKRYYKGTLTTSIDTISVALDMPEWYNCFTITATSSAVDSLIVKTLAADGTTWVVMGMTNLFSGADEDTINATTVSTEYLLNDPQPTKIRVESLSHDGSTCVIILTGKKQY